MHSYLLTPTFIHATKKNKNKNKKKKKKKKKKKVTS